MQRRMRIAVKALVTAHTPRVGVDALIEAEHAAIVEVHAPREGGIARNRRRRPVEARLHITKRMVIR